MNPCVFTEVMVETSKSVLYCPNQLILIQKYRYTRQLIIGQHTEITRLARKSIGPTLIITRLFTLFLTFHCLSLSPGQLPPYLNCSLSFSFCFDSFKLSQPGQCTQHSYSQCPCSLSHSPANGDGGEQYGCEEGHLCCKCVGVVSDGVFGDVGGL